jgi:hypothetical protein
MSGDSVEHSSGPRPFLLTLCLGAVLASPLYLIPHYISTRQLTHSIVALRRTSSYQHAQLLQRHADSIALQQKVHALHLDLASALKQKAQSEQNLCHALSCLQQSMKRLQSVASHLLTTLSLSCHIYRLPHHVAKDLSTSFADIARFIQRVELDQGSSTDHLAIVRMRELALKLESMSRPSQSSSSEPYTSI